jgi:cysteine desulfurase
VVPAALSAMSPYVITHFANPHSEDHAAGWAAADAIEHARAQVAAAMGAEPEEIYFTSGATEANNLAILGVAEAAAGRRTVIVGATEHKSVIGPARALARRGLKLRGAPVNADGMIDLDALRRLIDDDTLLVSIGAVNNEIGTVQHLAAISAMCHAVGALLHSDVTQALGWNAIDVEAAGLDYASASAHKVGGPKGIGTLFVAAGAADRIAPIIFGGEQERGLRPGTLPTPLCVGFGAACDELPDDDSVARWRGVTARLLAGIGAAIPGIRLNGAADPRHPGNLNILMPECDAAAFVARLQPGLAVSRGSACTSGTPEPSHVLRAIGLSAPEAERSIRLSTGPTTTAAEVDAAIGMIALANAPR